MYDIVGPGKSCNRDKCDTDLRCVDGTCVRKVFDGQACEADSDCASGWCDDLRCAKTGKPLSFYGTCERMDALTRFGLYPGGGNEVVVRGDYVVWWHGGSYLDLRYAPKNGRGPVVDLVHMGGSPVFVDRDALYHEVNRGELSRVEFATGATTVVASTVPSGPLSSMLAGDWFAFADSDCRRLQLVSKVNGARKEIIAPEDADPNGKGFARLTIESDVVYCAVGDAFYEYRIPDGPASRLAVEGFPIADGEVVVGLASDSERLWWFGGEVSTLPKARALYSMPIRGGTVKLHAAADSYGAYPAIDQSARRAYWASDDTIHWSSLDDESTHSAEAPELHGTSRVAFDADNLYWSSNWLFRRSKN